MKSLPSGQGSEKSNLKSHVWESDPWNHPNGEKTCKVCGCTILSGVIEPGFGRQKRFHYRDASNNTISTFKEMSCPLWIGDPAATATETKQGLRETNIEVQQLNEKVQQLQAENLSMREQVEQLRTIDLNALAQALVDFAKSHPEKLGPGKTTIYQLPSLLPTVDEEVDEDEIVEAVEVKQQLLSR